MGNTTVEAVYPAEPGDVELKGIDFASAPNNNTAATTTPAAGYALNSAINSANGTGVVQITIPSKDVYEYPDVTVIFTFSVEHTADLPKLLDMYSTNNVVEVKGHQVAGQPGFSWVFEDELYEAFAKSSYSTYKCKNANHSALQFRLKAETPAETRATISADPDWTKQIISLNNVSQFDWTLPANKNGVNIDVELYTVRDNGEECVFPYVVKFVNPFTVEIADIEIETKALATTADILDYVTIYFDGTAVYEDHDYTQYGIDLGLVGNVTSEYELDDINADIEKNPTWLTCTPAGLITWNNGGTKLETDVKVTSVAKIYNSQIGTFGAEGVVTLLATGKTASK